MHYKVNQAFILFLLLFIIACSKDQQSSDKDNQTSAAVEIHIAIDPEVSGFIRESNDIFSDKDIRLANNLSIVPKYIEIPGIHASEQIASGKTKVDGWITQRALVDLTNNNIRNLGAKQVDCKPLFATPIILAGSKQTLELNSDSQEISVSDFIVSQNKNLNFPVFYLENPKSSTIGLHSLLQLKQITSESDENYDSIFSATTGYNANSKILLKNILERQSPHLNFVVTTERQLAEFNQANPQSDLIAFYPKGKTVWLDYQFCRSDVEWVNASKQAAIKELSSFLAEQSSIALANGFRPKSAGLSEENPDSLLTEAKGVNVNLPKEKDIVFTGNDLASLALKKWDVQQRPLSIIFVLDTSGSIEQEGLDKITAAAQRVSARMSLNDLMSIVTVSTEASVLLEPTSDRGEFSESLAKLESIGGTALYDGILKGIQLATRKTPPEYRTAVIAITDGPDKNSMMNQDLTKQTIRQSIRNRNIDLYIVTLTDNNADFSSLKKISSEIYGTMEESSLENLSDTLQEIWHGL